ncbi:hypothetical protein Hanom_Chr00s066483g01787211 [Helianthus anomalus]
MILLCGILVLLLMKMMTVVWIFSVKRLKSRRRLLKVMQLQLRHLKRRNNGWRYNFVSTTNSLAKCLTKLSIYIPIKIQKVHITNIL